MTLRQRPTGDRPSVRDMSSRTAGIDRIADAVLSRTGHIAASATIATLARKVIPSSRRVSGISAAPGTVATTSRAGVSRRSARRDAPISTPRSPPTSTAMASATR